MGLDDILSVRRKEYGVCWGEKLGRRGRKKRRTLDDVHGRLLVAVFVLEFVHGAVAFDVEEGSRGRVWVSLV